MIINDLDGYYIVFDTKNWNTELDTLIIIIHNFKNLENLLLFSTIYKGFAIVLCITQYYTEFLLDVYTSP